MSKRFAFVMALLPALALAGCGSDEEFYTSPDTTPPLAPVLLGATVSGDVVNVWWQPNTEADLHGYFVYTANGEGFGKVYNDPTAPPYMAVPKELCNGNVWVTAVDKSGNESSPSASLDPTVTIPADPAEHQPKESPFIE